MYTIEQIAQACHQANKTWCEKHGDHSQLDWDHAPEWQRSSVVAGVVAYVKNPDIKPHQSHQSWMDMKLADGWTYGPEKNPELKTHPCIVPYADLSEEQRQKDQIFLGVCSQMAAKGVYTRTMFETEMFVDSQGEHWQISQFDLLDGGNRVLQLTVNSANNEIEANVILNLLNTSLSLVLEE